MLKIAVIDSNYRKDQFHSLAKSWILWEMQKIGIEQTSKEDADFLLCTVSSQQGIGDLKAVLKGANKKAKIILGGGGAWAPAIFEKIADLICVGEGQRFLRTFLTYGYEEAAKLPEAWVYGEKREVVPYSDGFPFDCPPLLHPDGAVRVFASRSCKKKCLFCQTGWEQAYKINPNIDKLQKNVDELLKKGKKVVCVTNDGAEESIRINGQQEFISASYEYLKKMDISRAIAKSVRIGVEGVSERLRSAVKKPIDNDGLCKLSFDALAKGVGVRWFFVNGLPYETNNDYEELKYLVRQIKKISKGVIMMNFHSFVPQPATPLSVIPLVDSYWEPFEDFRKWFFDGMGFTRRIQIVAPAQYKGRMERAKESMCANEEELRRGWFENDNANWRVKYLLTTEQRREIARKYIKEVSNA